MFYLPITQHMNLRVIINSLMYWSYICLYEFRIWECPTVGCAMERGRGGLQLRRSKWKQFLCCRSSRRTTSSSSAMWPSRSERPEHRSCERCQKWWTKIYFLFCEFSRTMWKNLINFLKYFFSLVFKTIIETSNLLIILQNLPQHRENRPGRVGLRRPRTFSPKGSSCGSDLVLAKYILVHYRFFCKFRNFSKLKDILSFSINLLKVITLGFQKTFESFLKLRKTSLFFLL